MSTATADLCGHRWPAVRDDHPEHECEQPAGHPTAVPCLCWCGATTTRKDR